MKCYQMPQNASVTAFTVSELLGTTNTGEGELPPTPGEITPSPHPNPN